jgi:acetyltransferase-like isoleucine patch superfamily enzyme
MDRFHAFGQGPSFPPFNSLRHALVYAYRAWHSGPTASLLGLSAWRQFRRTAAISPEALLGPRAWCMNLTGNRENIQIGSGCICRGLIRVEAYGNGRLQVDPDVYIGDDTLISVVDSVEIGSYTLIAHGVQIFDNDSHPLRSADRELDYKIIRGHSTVPRPPVGAAAVKIGRHVWLGLNCLIMKGVTVGDRAIVAPGSVVTDNVPEATLVGGVPARPIKSVE